MKTEAPVNPVEHTVSQLDNEDLEIIYEVTGKELRRRKSTPPPALSPEDTRPMSVPPPAPPYRAVTVSGKTVEVYATGASGAWERRAREIHAVEGFRVLFLDVEPKQRGFPPYLYERAARGDVTVGQWQLLRFSRRYAPYSCVVLMSDGSRAQDFLPLSDVRRSYERRQSQLSDSR